MHTSKLANITAIALVTLLALILGGCSRDAVPSGPALQPGANQDVLYSDFLALPNGPAPTHFTSGQPASLAPTPDDWEKLTVANGRLTLLTQSDERRAGYIRTPNMGRPIVRIGMQWTVTGKPGGGPGVAAIGITGSPVDPLKDSNEPISMHLLVQRDGWNFSVSPGPAAGDPRLIEIASGNFDPPLLEDGKTVHGVDVSVRGGDATIKLPDGHVSNVSDPRVAAWAGRFGFFEAYADAGAKDGIVGITRLWVDT